MKVLDTSRQEKAGQTGQVFSLFRPSRRQTGREKQTEYLSRLTRLSRHGLGRPDSPECPVFSMCQPAVRSVTLNLANFSEVAK